MATPKKKSVAKAPATRKPVAAVKAAPKKVATKAKPTGRAAVKPAVKAVSDKKKVATKKK